jgi:hypothetical protein
MTNDIATDEILAALRSSECLLEGGIGGALPGRDNRAQAEERDEKKPAAHGSLPNWMSTNSGLDGRP